MRNKGDTISTYAPTSFRRSLRGYDPEDVEAKLNALEQELTVASRENLELNDKLYERERELQKTLRDLSDAQERASRNRSSFSELGTEFESTLRMAEEQARQIRENAHNEAAEVLLSAREDASRTRDTAMRDAQSLLVESQRRAETIISDAESSSARFDLESAELLAKAKSELSAAERAATARILDAEKQASGIIATATREAQDLKNRAEQAMRDALDSIAASQAQLREQEAESEQRRKATEEWILTAESQQREMDALSEARRAEMDTEAHEALARAYEQADSHVEEALERAKSLRAEADRRLAAAEAHILTTVSVAQHTADSLLTAATTKAHRLAERTDELASSMLREADLQLMEARHRKSLLNRYVDDVRDILSEEAEPPTRPRDGAGEPMVIETLALSAAHAED